MNKAELIDVIATRTGLTKSYAERALYEALYAITKAMRNGEDVTLQGFGTFSVKHREARTGRNPQTGESIAIPASKTVGFKAGLARKDAGN